MPVKGGTPGSSLVSNAEQGVLADLEEANGFPRDPSKPKHPLATKAAMGRSHMGLRHTS